MTTRADRGRAPDAVRAANRTGERDAAARPLLRALFDAAIAALDPAPLVSRALARDGDLAAIMSRATDRARHGDRLDSITRGVLVIGAGKGVVSLAAAVEATLEGAVVDGLVIVPCGYDRPRSTSIARHRRLRRVAVAYGGHPLPNAQSVAATSTLICCLERHPDVPVVVVLTGGASSLLVRPAPGLTLTDKQRTTRLLLRSGADITEVNTVRKHLSAIKGGRLGEMLRGHRATVLVVSDVPGDDLGTIGSGPTVSDPTTYDDAYAILNAYDLVDRVPSAVLRHLERGMRGRISETPKRLQTASIHTILLASNATARAGAMREARRRGIVRAVDVKRPITGATRAAALVVARRIVRCQRTLPSGARALIVAGGETTVTLGRRAGRGGRNQDLALEVASVLAGHPGWALLSAGTDGIDGPTPAAGAFADGGSSRRAERAGGSIADALRRHDAFPLLGAMGDLFRPGPTGANVADLVLALVWKGREV